GRSRANVTGIPRSSACSPATAAQAYRHASIAIITRSKAITRSFGRPTAVLVPAAAVPQVLLLQKLHVQIEEQSVALAGVDQVIALTVRRIGLDAEMVPDTAEVDPDTVVAIRVRPIPIEPVEDHGLG